MWLIPTADSFPGAQALRAPASARGVDQEPRFFRGRDGTGNPPSNLTARYVGLLLVNFPWVLVQKLKVKSECSFLEQLGKKKGNIILPANSFWPHFEQVLNSFEQVWVWTGTPTVHQNCCPFRMGLNGFKRSWTHILRALTISRAKDE